MPELLFYQVAHRPLEAVLPVLVDRALGRGQRAVVRATTPERLAVLDEALWTWRDESFLPHGGAEDGEPETQPVYLTTGEERPNGAQVLFLADAAPVLAFEDYERVVLLFSGEDEAQLHAARESWKALKAAGRAATYWLQDENGKWGQRG